MSALRLLSLLRVFRVIVIYSISAGFVIFSTGCASVGQEFPVSRVVELKIGETTQQEVREMFGEPWRTGIEDGFVTWTYADYYYSLFSPADTQDLVIRFDKKRLVRSYTFNSSPNK
ncbi:hypothetical protein AU255_00755 [Methyloprofundus sedimenti]|uniref:Outer membrane protein assembly factor BamE domain-containing protein n=1 Tax=Methyloprofundus sedimenti TaxID=1420851 RepID=A0A1V8M4H9_9GAMM|nr:outer membrane protein assembly factor BamE [Methyloprofundus sedimenti]OQK16470.1 hypothetical protein AU255_00755 [Methyloprofundus sedimenti]